MAIRFVDDGVATLQRHVDLDEASIKIVLCSLLSYPFAVIFKRLPDHNYTLKNAYVIAVLAFYVFGILSLYDGIQTLLVSALGSYFLTRYLRTSAMPWINFIFLMLHLAYNHLKAQFFVEPDFSKVDITGAQMVLVMKLSAFGWNVYDARQRHDELSPYSRLRVVKRHPNLLPYLGYVFFFASILTGPAFDYADYDKFIHSTLFDDVPERKRPGRRKRKIPRLGLQAASKFAQGVAWAVALVVLTQYVTLERVFAPAFLERALVFRMFYLTALAFTYRLKYYTIWLIAEGSCILCGIGYNGYDKQTDSFRWDRVQNIDPYRFETSQNIHGCLESWNMNTNKWLKNYVYTRVAKRGKRPGFKSTLFTFVTSAFWHGTRPGYYLAFVIGAFLQTVGKLYRRNLRPMFLRADGTAKRSKWIYDAVGYVATELAVGFMVQPFVILDFKRSVQCWAAVNYYIIGVVAATMAVFNGPYGRQVVRWCKQYHPAPLPPATKLSTEEKERVKNVYRAAEVDELDVPSLGLPPIDVLENVNKAEFEMDMKELAEVWTSFRGRRKLVSDDDFEGLRDAYNNFKDEINDIFKSEAARPKAE